MATPLRLRVFRSGAQVDCKDFDCSIIKIGRLSAAQLCLDDDKVSRIHAVIDVAVDGTFSIIDMGSVEGTFVNGKRINRGELQFGDEIQVGNTLIHIEDASVSEQTLPHISITERALPPVLPVVATEAPVPVPTAAAEEFAPVSYAAVPFSEPVSSPPPAPVLQKAISQKAVAQKEVVQKRVSKAVRSPRRGTSGGPLGLEIRLLWGDQPLESHYFAPSQKAHFRVGSSSSVDFPMRAALLSGAHMEVVSFNKGHASLQFTEKMEGEFHANGKSPLRLSDAIKTRVAALEKDAYSIDLHDSDFMWINLGDDIVLEAHMDTEPKPAWVPFLNRIDFSALNIFLVIALLGSLFVISALNTAGKGMGLVDELSANDARLVKLIEQSPEIQQNIQRKFENIQKSAGEAAARAQGTEGEMGKKNATAKEGRSAPKGDPDDNNHQRNRLTALFSSGLGGGAGATALGQGRGGAARAALGNLAGSKIGDAAGRGGYGMRGIGPGGGGRSLVSIGVGDLGTKSGASLGPGGGNIGRLAGRSTNEVPTLAGDTPLVSGNIDAELIRQVIRRNSSKIRACYEDQLIRYPQLAGRIAIRFVINSEGTVDSSRVQASTMNNAEMGNCVANKIRLLEFPRPKGGGTAQVTYPFIFKPAG